MTMLLLSLLGSFYISLFEIDESFPFFVLALPPFILDLVVAEFLSLPLILCFLQLLCVRLFAYVSSLISNEESSESTSSCLIEVSVVS